MTYNDLLGGVMEDLQRYHPVAMGIAGWRAEVGILLILTWIKYIFHPEILHMQFHPQNEIWYDLSPQNPHQCLHVLQDLLPEQLLGTEKKRYKSGKEK